MDPLRARMIEGARRHFLTCGFRGVTMDDLAAELGVSKKTLYSRFESKTRLLEAVIDEQFRRMGEDCSRIVSDTRAEFPDTLRGLTASMHRHAAEIQPPFVKDLRQAAPEIFQRVEKLRRAHIELYFGDLMQRGRRTGFIRRDVPPQLIIEILLGAARAILNPERLEELGLTPKTGLEMIMKVVLEGSVASSGTARAETASGT